MRVYAQGTTAYVARTAYVLSDPFNMNAGGCGSVCGCLADTQGAARALRAQCRMNAPQLSTPLLSMIM